MFLFGFPLFGRCLFSTLAGYTLGTFSTTTAASLGVELEEGISRGTTFFLTFLYSMGSTSSDCFFVKSPSCDSVLTLFGGFEVCGLLRAG